jgi:4-amino-4-deoxy-L-arabinose transferase-like glycosyltransferase
MRGGRALLLGIVALGLCLRLFHIGAQNLWIDEYLTLEVATAKPGYPIWQLLRHNVHGPLHTFVVFLLRSVSENEGWLRLPSALAGTATIPLLFAWVRPRFGARAGLWAALLLAVNPLHVHYSQELRNYAFAVMFVVAGGVLLDRALARASRVRDAALAACIAASVLSNFSATFSFLVHALSFFRRAGANRASTRRWAVITLLVVALISPWIYRVTTYVDFGRLATPVRPGQIETEERLRGDTTFRFEAIPYAAFAYSVGFTLGPSLRELHAEPSLGNVVSRHAATVAWVGVLFGALALAGVRLGGRARGAWAVVEPVLYVVLPLAATLLLNWQNAKAFNVRYVLVGLPMYLALVAIGIAGLPKVLGRVAGLLVGLTCAASLWNHYFDPRYAKEDVRGAVRAVEAKLAPGECIFAPTVWQLVEHYARSPAPVFYVFRDPPGIMQDQMRQVFLQCDSLWYIRAREWVDDADGRVLAEIESRYSRVDTMEFPGVSALRFARTN